MTPVFMSLPRTLRLAALAVAMAATAAYADDYADVNQLLRTGKLAEAQVKADQYLVTKPRDPQMRFLKGVIQTELGKPADAVSTFTKLTEDYPELPEPYNNLAVLYAGQSQFDKARAALEMAIRTNPSYATAHENLGDVYAKLASQAYSKALQLDSGNTGVQPKLGLIRDLFAPGAKGQKPTVAAASAKPPTTVVAAAPAPVPPVKATAPAPSAAPAAAPAASSNDMSDVEVTVQAWAAAWASQDMRAYLAAYGKDFDPQGSQSRSDWEAERKQRIVGKSRISVKLSDITVTVKGATASARFRQAYSADNLNVTSRKKLDLVKVGDRWVIVKESTGG